MSEWKSVRLEILARDIQEVDAPISIDEESKIADDTVFPWDILEDDGKKQIPLSLPAKQKAQLDYLREMTEVPTQRFLRKHLASIIDNEARRVWKEYNQDVC